MKMKNDKTKLAEKRCLGEGAVLDNPIQGWG